MTYSKTYRCAVLLWLAVLSSSASPATARAQQPRAQANGTSPAAQFAAAADETDGDLAVPSRRPAKRSVLEPSTAKWLQDESSALVNDGSSPDDLSPPDMLSPESAPPPEAMEVLPGQLGPRALPPALPPSLHAAPLENIPKSKVRQQPMLRDSWLYRPFNFSLFEGGLFATPPIAPQFNTAVSYFTGFRIGWDFNTHFGGETRFGFSKVFLLDASHNTEVGYQQIFYFDQSLLIYPWGDTRWRPFLALGTGLADVLIVDNAGLRLHPGAFNMPMGFGVKYRYGPRMAFRADFRDNLTFSGAGGLRTLNNIEAVGGIEIHFGGGTRRSYWPWNPSRHWW
ncbi:MAG: outer membrane beta-barrel protein [Pirellulales bacterium]